MILKGSQRGGGADLAIHLMNGFDNERVEIAEVYGTVAPDLYGAFAEFEAVASGTKAKEYLYSLSINPPSPLSREQYHQAIQDIETRLGLTDQPRAVVFHVKDGREHCHVVWSRIDVEHMRAVHMAHDRCKLMDLACDLARKFDLVLPPGLKAWEDKQRVEKERLEPTLAEKAQTEATGLTPDQRRAEITACYEQSDSAEAFINALEQQGYVLAQGDRRGFVIVDRFGGVHSLSRYVKGQAAKAIKARLAPLRPQDLPTVEQAKDIVRQRNQAQGEKQREGEGDKRRRFEDSRRKAQAALAARHEKRRAALRGKEQELLIRQQAEKLSLHAAQKTESAGLLFRMQSVVTDLIRRTPGLRSVLGRFQQLKQLDPKERHRLEGEALDRRHARERRDIGREERMLSRLETRERQSLERALNRAARRAQELDRNLRDEFREAAQDRTAVQRREFTAGALQQDFNDAAEFEEGADRAGEGDDDDAPDWKHRAEDKGLNRRPRRGHRRSRRLGYKRDRD